MARAAIVKGQKAGCSGGTGRKAHHGVDAATVLIPARSAGSEHGAVPFPAFEVARGRQPRGGFAFTGVENVQGRMRCLARLRRGRRDAEKKIIQTIMLQKPWVLHALEAERRSTENHFPVG